MISKFIGIPLGTVFNKWTTLSEAIRTKKDIYYLCRCQCGTEKEVVAWTLLNGSSKGCKGCIIRHKADIHIGDIFTRWEVVSEPILDNIHGVYYTCKCQCGTKKLVSAATLRTGKSTGCKACADYHPNTNCIAPNIGDTFHDWRVIGGVTSDQRRALCWKCECKCGNVSWIRYSKLISGASKRCRSCAAKLRRNHLAYSYSSSREGYLYCIISGDYIKIGFTTNTEKRLKDLQKENPVTLEVVWLRKEESHLEEAWHKKLTALGLHHRGEWFKKPEDMSILDTL